jgi:putative Mg2+ transporter-C (MgtC) family protein
VDERTIILRLGLSLLLGGLLGLEREIRGQAAGLRTHLLVCLGACLFTLVSVAAAQPLSEGAPSGVEADITRIASQIVVGIGFLGGGAIVRHGTSIKGLTTAANLWLTASVGMASGIGFFLGASVTVGLALLVLVGLRPVERLINRLRSHHQIEGDAEGSSEAQPPPGS